MQERLLEAEYKRSIAESSSSFWPSFILGDSLRIVFQNLLLESNEEIVQCSGRVWRILLQVCCLYLSFPSKPLHYTLLGCGFPWTVRAPGCPYLFIPSKPPDQHSNFIVLYLIGSTQTSCEWL